MDEVWFSVKAVTHREGKEDIVSHEKLSVAPLTLKLINDSPEGEVSLLALNYIYSEVEALLVRARLCAARGLSVSEVEALSESELAEYDRHWGPRY